MKKKKKTEDFPSTNWELPWAILICAVVSLLPPLTIIFLPLGVMLFSIWLVVGSDPDKGGILGNRISENSSIYFLIAVVLIVMVSVILLLYLHLNQSPLK